MNTDITNYTDEVQLLFLRFLVTDAELFSRCQNIIEPAYFSKKYQPAVELIKSHSSEYSAIPTTEQITAVSRVVLEPLPSITPDHHNWFLREFEVFCRHKALEKAIVESVDLLEQQNYGEVENKVKAASQVGLIKDLGLDYFANPKERLEWIKAQAGAVSTGWKSIDHKLYGGLNRGEITIFAGGSGAGKSLFLQNFAINWVLTGLNVVYLSLELSEQLISMRLDAMISGYSTKDILRNIEDVHLRVKMKSKGSGRLRVKQMTSGVTANDIRVFLREYEIECGERVDCLLVDYLDLMMPISKKVSASDLFIKDKYVSEELRNLAVERKLLMVTASQLNRGAVEEIEFDHSHIAGGISKIQTADNVVGIFTSNAMRERGRYQIQFMKTRSSAGVGTKVDLAFDPDTLRISDLADGEADALTVTATGLVDQLKRNSTIKSENPQNKDTINKALDMREFLKKNSL